MLTPDECFALYPAGSEGIIELIRQRLVTPAEGGHRHHLLIINRRRSGMMALWSRLLGREVTADMIPVVSVTGPEHYQIHAGLARCYQAAGSKGRFSAHGLASTLLAKFAEMDDRGWEEHREMHRDAVLALAQDPEWQIKNRAAQRKSWSENAKRRENHKAALKLVAQRPEWLEKKTAQIRGLFTDQEYRARNKATLQALHNDPTYKEAHKKAVQAMAQRPEWKEKHLAMVRARFQDPEQLARHKEAMIARSDNQNWRANHKAAIQALAKTPEFLANCKAAQEAMHPDVIVTYPDGREEKFPGQTAAAKALGIKSHKSIGNYINGKTKTFIGPLKGYSFRYAVSEAA